MDIIMTLEQIKKLTDVNSLNDQTDLIFKLGQIRGICDQAIADRKHEIRISDEAQQHVLQEQKGRHELFDIVMESKEKSEKTFAEVCKEVMPEEPCTDDDEKVIKLLERNGSHMNLKFEIGSRFPNKKYAKTVVDLLAKDGICTMQDLMEIFDDPEKLRMIKYYQSAKKDDLKKLNEIFPVFELGDSTCAKIAALYETANENKDKTGQDILTDFIGESTVRHRNAIMRFGILNTNQLYYYLSHHTMKEYKQIRNVGIVPGNVYWLYFHINGKVEK